MDWPSPRPPSWTQPASFALRGSVFRMPESKATPYEMEPGASQLHPHGARCRTRARAHTHTHSGRGRADDEAPTCRASRDRSSDGSRADYVVWPAQQAVLAAATPDPLSMRGPEKPRGRRLRFAAIASGPPRIESKRRPHREGKVWPAPRAGKALPAPQDHEIQSQI